MFLGAAGAQLVRKLCLMVRTHVNICGNDKRLKHRTSPSSKTHAVLFEFMRKASAYLIFNWRRGWDSNPRTSSSPVTRFRVERVTAASLPLRPAKDSSGSWHKEQEGVNQNPLSSLLEGELLHMGPQRNPFLLEWPLIVSGHDNFIFS